jgi:imidazole glycerol-phosphate synthase subunit HisH
MAEVTLVDYGVGNVKAYLHLFERLNIAANTASSPSGISAARRLILPGVGAFDWAMRKLAESGLRHALDAAALKDRKPIFGVCVGMQMMAERSDEGRAEGLGWFAADVKRMGEGANQQVPLPHMGWNTMQPKLSHRLFDNLSAPHFYFLHSYAVVPRNVEDTLATTFYGHEFTSAIAQDNIMATQFHPEKSHRWGMTLLKNFASC